MITTRREQSMVRIAQISRRKRLKMLVIKKQIRNQMLAQMKEKKIHHLQDRILKVELIQKMKQLKHRT